MTKNEMADHIEQAIEYLQAGLLVACQVRLEEVHQSLLEGGPEED